MSTDDIRIYLGDNTDLSDVEIARIAPEIYNRLDYSPMYEQIDTLTLLLTTAHSRYEDTFAPATAGDDQ